MIISIEQFSRRAFPCQADKLLLYFHLIHQARQYADIAGKRVLKKEAERVREKVLFTESLTGVKV